MKKLVFPVILALVAVFSFNSCAPDGDPTVKMKENIVKNQNYKGLDTDKEEWTAQFSAATFTASCPADKLTLTSSKWEVKANADGKTGVITIKEVKSLRDGKTGTVEDIIGTVENNGAKIILKSGAITITLQK